MASGKMIKVALNALDRMSHMFGRKPKEAGHISTGKRGEELAYFHLRKMGYTVVARNYRTARHRGEIDLIGWDGDSLCVIEVKTRSTRAVKAAEVAVDRKKQDELRTVAHEYLRNIHAGTAVRGDVVSVYTDIEPPEINIFKNAFRVR